jgi:hypothetical protein
MVTFRLPPGLHIDVRRRQKLGWATYKSAGYPARAFDVIGERTTWNGIAVTVAERTVTFSNLPIQTGVVRVTLGPGVVAGRPGVVTLTALERGERVMAAARTPATWLR